MLVCYDVEDDKARKKLADRLKDLGLEPVQKSVMWGFLNEAEEREVPRIFKELLKSGADRAVVLRSDLASEGGAAGFGYGPGDFAPPKAHEIL